MWRRWWCWPKIKWQYGLVALAWQMPPPPPHTHTHPGPTCVDGRAHSSSVSNGATFCLSGGAALGAPAMIP